MPDSTVTTPPGMNSSEGASSRSNGGVSVAFTPRPGPPPQVSQPPPAHAEDDSDGEDKIVPAEQVLDGAETNPGAPRRGLFRRADKPTGKRGRPEKAPKPEKALTPAARKRALDGKRRKMRLGSRYGGDRWKRRLLEFALIGGLVFALAAMVIAIQKPSRSQIADEVNKQLASSGLNFPNGEAVMWAGQALRVWGTWNEKSPDTRATLLAPFLSQGMDAQAGWNGKGSQEVIYASMNPQPKTSDSSHAIISAAYQRADLTWACVSMPVYAYHPKEFSSNAPWAFALAGNPVPTACNPRTGAVPLPGPGSTMKVDADIGRNLATSFFPGFFSAWAASDSNALTQYTDSGVTTMGLGGAMASIPPPVIGDVSVLVDASGVVEGKTYAATVPVTWTVGSTTSKVSAVYNVPITKRGDRWYVTGEPVAAAQAPEVIGGQPGSVPAPGDGVTPDPKTYPSLPTTAPEPAPSSVNPAVTTPAAKAAPKAGTPAPKTGGS